MKRPLILTSNRPAPETAVSPRLDYRELTAALRADISYPPAKTGDLFSRVEEKTASDWRQGWTASRKRDVSVFVSLSEKAGIPLALLTRRVIPASGKSGKGVPHVMVAHYLTSERKRALQARTGYLHRFDGIVVLCRTQERYLREEVGLAPERVHFLYDKVDSHFWKPLSDAVAPDSSLTTPYCLSVGRERRDYETLMDAARLLPEMNFVIVASSPWSRGTENAQNRALPPNVTLRKNLRWEELRSLYQNSAICIVPLQVGTDYAAGVNGVLEAMSMAKPLIVSGTPGILDYPDPYTTALVVPPGDAAALTRAIQHFLNHPHQAAEFARAARRCITDGRNLDTYIASLVRLTQEAAGISLSEGAPR